MPATARRRVATGLERGGAGLLCRATCTGPEAWVGEAGAGIHPPDRQEPTVGLRQDHQAVTHRSCVGRVDCTCAYLTINFFDCLVKRRPARAVIGYAW